MYTKEYPEVLFPQFPEQFVQAASLLRKDLKERMSVMQFSQLLPTDTAVLKVNV